MDASNPSSVFGTKGTGTEPPCSVDTFVETLEAHPSWECSFHCGWPASKPCGLCASCLAMNKQPAKTEHFGFTCPACGCKGHGTLSTVS